MKKVIDAIFYAGVYAHVIFNQLADRVSEFLRGIRGR